MRSRALGFFFLRKCGGDDTWNISHVKENAIQIFGFERFQDLNYKVFLLSG